jgi:hypothetical protein
MRHSLIGLATILLLVARCANADDNPGCGFDESLGDHLSQRISAIGAGTITDGKAVHLRDVIDDKPANCKTACLANANTAGVELRQDGKWVCIGVPGKGKLGTSFGWIPASRWRPSDRHPQAMANWAGVWQNETAKITVQPNDAGQLAITGHAVRGSGTEGMDFYGDFELSGKLEHDVLTGPAGDSCEVAIRLVGEFLVVIDNGACGGMGVSFDGMYRLRHR